MGFMGCGNGPQIDAAVQQLFTSREQDPPLDRALAIFEVLRAGYGIAVLSQAALIGESGGLRLGGERQAEGEYERGDSCIHR